MHGTALYESRADVGITGNVVTGENGEVTKTFPRETSATLISPRPAGNGVGHSSGVWEQKTEEGGAKSGVGGFTAPAGDVS